MLYYTGSEEERTERETIMTVSYEWATELTTTTDTDAHEADEVLDVSHWDTYEQARAFAANPVDDPGTEWRVVLVRDDDGGRAWAYMEAGALPDNFRDAYGNCTARVPQRFHKEVARTA